LFGFEGRGTVTPGAAGDLAIFVLDELEWAPPEMVDMPHGGRRLRRPPGGYRTTVVQGAVTQSNGILASARPGALLAPTEDVPFDA
jgi:N-acyl-D-aspartate/D-glutamate deacylase